MCRPLTTTEARPNARPRCSKGDVKQSVVLSFGRQKRRSAFALEHSNRHRTLQQELGGWEESRRPQEGGGVGRSCLMGWFISQDPGTAYFRCHHCSSRISHPPPAKGVFWAKGVAGLQVAALQAHVQELEAGVRVRGEQRAAEHIVGQRHALQPHWQGCNHLWRTTREAARLKGMDDKGSFD